MEMVMSSSRSSSSCCMGVMAVVAVSGSVALLSVQMHRRLGNEFRRRAEEELRLDYQLQGGGRSHDKRCETTAATKMKKVRFADDVVDSRPPIARTTGGAAIAPHRRPVVDDVPTIPS